MKELNIGERDIVELSETSKRNVEMSSFDLM